MDHPKRKIGNVNPTIKNIIAADFTFWTAMYLFYPLMSVFIVNEVGGTIKNAAIATALYYLFRGLLDIFLGKLFKLDSDQKKLAFIFIGTSILVLSFILFYMSSTILQIYLIYALMGIGMGTLRPNQYSLYSKFLDSGKETEEWGYFDAINLFGVVIASLVAGFTVETFGFRSLFVFSAILGALSLLPYLFIYKKL